MWKRSATLSKRSAKPPCTNEKAADRASDLVRDYFSLQHLDEVDTSCPLIGLANVLCR